MALPPLKVDGRSFKLSRKFVLLRLHDKVVQFDSWDALRIHYWEQARRLGPEFFHARFFAFDGKSWQEMTRPGFPN